jgi:uncharacterized repeat protein (TIGR03803 family)
MKSFVFGRSALSSCVTAAMLAGCGESLNVTALRDQAAMRPLPRRSSTNRYVTLYSFGISNDGVHPEGSLIHVGDKLYGTTAEGGADGLGTVFRITQGGKEKILYSFHAAPDSNEPGGNFISVKGTLYGMAGGGEYREGTVYGITTNRIERVLYSFGAYPHDAASPPDNAQLVYVNQILFGMTEEGGQYNAGAVFSVSMQRHEQVLYSFQPFSPKDGWEPHGGLLYLRGRFYGTTWTGGCYPSRCYRYDGSGTVFSLSTNGKQKLLHSFESVSDGRLPAAGLIHASNMLYGTTYGGGDYSEGTVFAVGIASKREEVIHSFGSGSDGSLPFAALLKVGGTLYGTTWQGGTYGGGTVFSINTATGSEEVLHSFGYGSDGATPLAGLTDVNGILYGTTSAGGSYGDGTVFALTP